MPDPFDKLTARSLLCSPPTEVASGARPRGFPNPEGSPRSLRSGAGFRGAGRPLKTLRLTRENGLNALVSR